MKKSNLAIVALLILALIGFGLYFKDHAVQSSVEKAQAEKLKTIENEIATMTADAERSKQDAIEQARIADEAKRMAEAKAAKVEAEKETLVNELNLRLKREAAERKEAELAQEKLEKTLTDLKAAQADALAKLAELEKAKSESDQSDAGQLRKVVESQETELQKLAMENNALKERQQLLEKQQIETEESIIRAGGRIDLPYPEIRSPNYKRREALYFKERVAGSVD